MNKAIELIEKSLAEADAELTSLAHKSCPSCGFLEVNPDGVARREELIALSVDWREALKVLKQKQN